MVNLISKTQAISTVIFLIALVLVFHFLVLANVISYEIVWAGKINSIQEMYVFEISSIVVNLVLLLALLIKASYVRINIPERVINAVLWFFVFVFALNTIGNLMAKTLFERMVFTPLTLILALLIWRILRADQQVGR